MLTKKKILVVDDEPAMLGFLSLKLRISGYDVVTAANGYEALKLCGSENPDLIVLDAIMPGMNGFEVLERIRSDSKLPVILCSAGSSDLQESLRLGANDFLFKPFTADDLIKKIERLLLHKE